jgi:hypothetical protein
MRQLAHMLRRRVTYDSGTAATVNLTIGLWLMLSAWIVGYDQERAFWVPIGTGALVAASAGLRLGTRLNGTAFHVADLAIAAWLVVAAVSIAEGAKPFWNDTISAAALATLAVVGLAAQARRPARRDNREAAAGGRPRVVN